MLRRLYRISLTTLCVLTFGSVLALDKPQVQGAKTQLEFVGGIPLLTIDGATNGGIVWFSLRNPTKKDLPVLVSIGDFLSASSKRSMSPKVAFSRDGGTAGSFYSLPALKPNEILFLKVEVSGIWEAGESSAPVFNNGVPIDTLRALKYNVPFGVSIEAKDPQRPEVPFRRGGPGILVFKNSDAMSYPIRWQLFIPGEDTLMGERSLLLPPTSVIPISVSMPESWFTQCFAGFFKRQERDALLTLRLDPPGTIANPVLPVKTIPIKLSLEYWSAGTEAFFGNLILFLVLAAGGFTSLILSLWIPNKLRRIDLTKDLEHLGAEIREISLKTDSSLRVALRVQRMRLQETLQSLDLLGPNLPAVLEKFQKDIVTLSRRTELTKRFDDVMGHLEDLRGKTRGVSPTLLDEAMESLEKAADVLKKVDIEESELQKVQTLILEAHQRLVNLADDNGVFAKDLAARVKNLRIEFDEQNGPIGSRNKCREIRATMKDIFEIVENARYESESAITPEKYHRIDMKVEKLNVIQQYVQCFEDSQSDIERRKRIFDCEEKLLNMLKLQTWNALDCARRMTSEIEQDIFSANVEKALKANEVVIKVEPLHPAQNEPVQLKVCFNDETLNSCAAREEFVCVWDFGVIGREEGWEISHYFRDRTESLAKVSFKSRSGKQIEGQREDQIDLEPVQKKKKWDDRCKVELANFLIALTVALLGLVAGAREQIVKLDMFSGLIAVFSLGFGADTIKNLITKRPQ